MSWQLSRWVHLRSYSTVFLLACYSQNIDSNSYLCPRIGSVSFFLWLLLRFSLWSLVFRSLTDMPRFWGFCFYFNPTWCSLSCLDLGVISVTNFEKSWHYFFKYFDLFSSSWGILILHHLVMSRSSLMSNYVFLSHALVSLCFTLDKSCWLIFKFTDFFRSADGFIGGILHLCYSVFYSSIAMFFSL